MYIQSPFPNLYSWELAFIRDMYLYTMAWPCSLQGARVECKEFDLLIHTKATVNYRILRQKPKKCFFCMAGKK